MKERLGEEEARDESSRTICKAVGLSAKTSADRLGIRERAVRHMQCLSASMY